MSMVGLYAVVMLVASAFMTWRVKHRSVARGTLPGTVGFQSRRREYSIWLLLDHDRDDPPELIATRCAVSTGAILGGGESGGSRIGRLASIGTFTAPGGPVSLTALGPSGTRFVVAPAGEVGLGSVAVLALAGAVLFYGGLALAGIGLLERYVLSS